MNRQAKTIEATMRAWHAAQAGIAPVIGESGFRILFARSLHLTCREHPWLCRVEKATDTQLTALRANLESESEERALEASRALLANFTNLLRTLIGEALTSRLLDPVPSGPVHGK